MAIIHGEPSQREKQMRKREVATGFMPKADELKALVTNICEEADALVPQKGRVSVSQLAGGLASIQRNLKACSALTRGFSGVVKPYDIPADLLYLYNLANSLVRAHPSLEYKQTVAELRTLIERLSKLRGNVQLMHDALRELYSPQQPAGQPAVDGRPSVDQDIEPGDLDDAPDEPLDYDKEGLEQFSQYDLMMPGAESPELVKVLHVPVIATFNRTTSIEELNSRGFDAMNLAGYIILNKAYILGINKAKCKVEGYDQERVLAGALRNIGDKLNDPISLVCETGVPYAKGGWVYYWIGPQSYHRTLGGKLDTRLTVEDFRFPFGPKV